MSDLLLNLVGPQQAIKVRFEANPVLNAINTMWILNEADDLSGLDDWIYETARNLTPQRRRINQQLSGLIYNAAKSGDQTGWSNYPAWVAHVKTLDPYAIRDQEIADTLEHAQHVLEGKIPEIPDLLADKALYLDIVARVYAQKEAVHTFEPDTYAGRHDLFNDPPALLDQIVEHLTFMWENALAAAWEQDLPAIQAVVTAHQKLDFTGLTFAEILRYVTGRDVPEKWGCHEEEIQEVVFIPSPHIGPYLMMMSCEEGVITIVFGARLPEGVTTTHPGLSRTELLMRLNALADDTRLRILKWIAADGEKGAQEIMTHFDLSQSGASRHLRQLSATGFLIERRHEGAKRYQINRERIDDTLHALHAYLE